MEPELNELRRQVAVLEERMKTMDTKSESAYERLILEIARLKEQVGTDMARLKEQIGSEMAQMKDQFSAEMARRESRQMVWVILLIGAFFAADRFLGRNTQPAVQNPPPAAAQSSATAGQPAIAQSAPAPGNREAR